MPNIHKEFSEAKKCDLNKKATEAGNEKPWKYDQSLTNNLF